MIRRRVTLFAFLVLCVGIASTIVHVRWPQFIHQNSLGPIENVSSKFQAHEITDSEAQKSNAIFDQSIREIIEQDQTAERGKVHYFCDGYLLSDPNSHNQQASWVCMFNPTQRTAKLKFTFYYEDSDPTFFDYEIPPEINQTIPLRTCKQIIPNRRFGAKVESSEPIILQVTTAYYGKDDKEDSYTRAMHSVICNDTLSRINYYADGLVIDRKGTRLKEPEWAFLLNPNNETAKVLFQAYYADGIKKTYALNIEPRRLFPLNMDNLVVKNKSFGAKYISNIPIAIQQTRWIEEEDRRTIRSAYSIMAKPGTSPTPQ